MNYKIFEEFVLVFYIDMCSYFFLTQFSIRINFEHNFLVNF